MLLDEGDPHLVDALERQFFASHVTEEVLFATGRGIAPWMASVTFGGPDLRTAYIGSLKGNRVPYFKAPAPGLPMVHWND
jgi:gluconolactonase